MEIIKKELTPLSASRIKVLEGCSYIYWCNYHLNIPQPQNEGALKGSVVHTIFEMLLNPRHKHHFNDIIKHNSIEGSKIVVRLVRKLIKNSNLPLECYNQINEMILVGLKEDFFVKGGKLVAPEYKFDITNEEPQYHIKGFIDKPFTKSKEIIIDDFKSSKKKFVGEECYANIQALMYSLAATKIWPKLKPIVRFIFLQFPEDPILKVEFNQDVLKGFEEYLAMIQKKVDNFSESDAQNGFAADKEYSSKEFKGKLLCGFGKRPNQLKKDGVPYWNCPYKWAKDYFVLVKDNKVLKSSLKIEDLNPKDGELIETRHFAGCPRWNNNAINDLKIKDFSNPLDDF